MMSYEEFKAMKSLKTVEDFVKSIEADYHCNGLENVETYMAILPEYEKDVLEALEVANFGEFDWYIKARLTRSGIFAS